jgi:ATP-dependent protease Clp ATPase subunit
VFLSRFDAIVLLRDLGVDELVPILLESPDSGNRQARTYFETRGIRLTLSHAAVCRIAGVLAASVRGSPPPASRASAPAPCARSSTA